MQGTTCSAVPNYAGRLLALNIERCRRFQCGGFLLGTVNPVAMVPPNAQMDRIHAGIQQGILVDVTDRQRDLQIGGSMVKKPTVESTDKKTYIQFRVLPNDRGGKDIVIVGHHGVQGDEEQKEYEKQHADSIQLDLPPGMDDPERYVLKTEDFSCK